MQILAMILMAAAQPLAGAPTNAVQTPPVTCTDWPVDRTIALPADRTVIAAALISLHWAGARREFSREREAAPALAGVLVGDGLIDPVEQDVLCEMTHPDRGERVMLTIGGESQGEIWAHAGYTEDILRDALKGIVPEETRFDGSNLLQGK